ncbi:hypothetical protein ACA910_001184 [Epithemia clementina (nom. ined.)]
MIPSATTSCLWVALFLGQLLQKLALAQQEPTVAPFVSSVAPTYGIPQPVAPPNAFAPRGRPSCYTNTKDLYEDMAAIAPDSDFTSRHIFKLCPNTVIDLDEMEPASDQFSAFLTAKSYTTIQCGDQGSVTDNCIVRNGIYGFLTGPFGGSAFFYWFMTGIQVKGIIFEGQRFNSLLFQAKGDVTFTDCIWRHQQGSGLVVSHFDPDMGTAPGPDLLVLKFQNCMFEYITQTAGGSGGTEFEGLVRTFSAYHHLIFDSCVFRHNYFPGTFQSPRGWAMKIAGGTLELHNSCFYNNTFIGWSMIEAFSDATVIENGNFAESPHYVPIPDPQWRGPNGTTHVVSSVSSAVTYTCGFIARSSSMEPRTLQEITCMEASESTCTSTGYHTSPEANDTTTTPSNSLLKVGSPSSATIFKRGNNLIGNPALVVLVLLASGCLGVSLW